MPAAPCQLVKKLRGTWQRFQFLLPLDYFDRATRPGAVQDDGPGVKRFRRRELCGPHAVCASPPGAPPHRHQGLLHVVGRPELHGLEVAADLEALGEHQYWHVPVYLDGPGEQEAALEIAAPLIDND